MIIVRVPLRIPIGGGGTDLPSYYSKFGGEWISAAINKYIYIVIHKRSDNFIKASYSKTEIVESSEKIQHPLIREALKLLKIEGGIEISSFADLPANSGMGSSCSFCVALLSALHTYLKSNPTKQEIAEQACYIAMNILNEPSGKQDEYIAAYGGLRSFSASKDGQVATEVLFPGKLSTDVIRDLENNLLFFYTGIQRDTRDILQIQKEATSNNDQDIINNLHRVKEIGIEIKSVLEKGDLRRFGELLDVHWQEKIKRGGTSNQQINQWYELAKKSGALGGKLMGAGGGGFFMFYCSDRKNELRKAMAAEGLKEHFFHFDLEGVKVMADFI